MRAVKKGQVYGQIPYNFYTTNIDTALVDAYYAGKVIFPDKFQDIDPVKKSEEIYSFILGKPIYEQMAKDYGDLKSSAKRTTFALLFSMMDFVFSGDGNVVG